MTWRERQRFNADTRRLRFFLGLFAQLHLGRLGLAHRAMSKHRRDRREQSGNCVGDLSRFHTARQRESAARIRRGRPRKNSKLTR